MATNLVMSEGRLPEVTAPYAVTSGQGVLVGALFGIAQTDALISTPVTIDTRGVYDITKLTTDAPTVGARLYWDNTNRRLTTTASGNTLVGVCLQAPATNAPTVVCRLNGSF
jgi:predicted RecA/RadA family phage recombinase